MLCASAAQCHLLAKLGKAENKLQINSTLTLIKKQGYEDLAH